MRYFIFLIIICFNISCSNDIKTSRQPTLILFDNVDTIARLTMKLPETLDTTYKWYDASDYFCGDRIKYRFNSRKYRIVKETGWISSDVIDSGFYFTISHSPNYSCDSGKSFTLIPQWFRQKQQIRNPRLYNYLYSDSNFIVSNRQCYLFIYIGSNHRSTKNFDMVTAYTVFNSRLIQFEFKSNIMTRDTFIHKSLTVLKSITME